MRHICMLGHLVVLCVVGSASAWGHENDPHAEWMKSLLQPDFPLSSCCGPGDQYYVREYRPGRRKGIAFDATVIGRLGQPDFPIEIPQEKVIWNRVNPTGRGVVFINNVGWGPHVLCSCRALECKMAR
jgi:hypothetical protein